MVPPDKVAPTLPRWVMSLLRRDRAGGEEVRGEALATARSEVRRPKLKSIADVERYYELKKEGFRLWMNEDALQN